MASVTRNAIITALVGGTAGGGIGLLIIFFVSGAIASPVSRAAGLLNDIAHGCGDLSRRMVVETRDELGLLANSFNLFVTSLNKSISEVRSSTETIAAASTEIANGNLDLSSRTEAQASNLEEPAAAMEELTSTIKLNAENANMANELVFKASDFAVTGGEVVDEVVQTMGEISESSRRIVDIIAVIDDIAFHTNILALNASVEAARAREQGRRSAIWRNVLRLQPKKSRT